ncbi:MAG TPA: HAD family hydrolase [Anaerolineaceae bacterium]|nr:HAD family hydrolase [Anaerolineaceae bacterium]
MKFAAFRFILFDLGSTLLYFDGKWPEVMADSFTVLAEQVAICGYEIDRKEFAADFSQRLHEYYAQRETEFIEHTTEYILRSLLYDYGYPDALDANLRPALNAMYAVTQRNWKLEKDAIPVLRQLLRRGCRMAIVSNAGDAQDVDTLVKQHGLAEFFEFVLISARVGIRKPDPRIFQMALDRLEALPEQTLMVGDTLGADILGARHAGIKSAWITRRADRPDNRDHEDTIQADYTIATLGELLNIVK